MHYFLTWFNLSQFYWLPSCYATEETKQYLTCKTIKPPVCGCHAVVCPSPFPINYTSYRHLDKSTKYSRVWNTHARRAQVWSFCATKGSIHTLLLSFGVYSKFKSMVPLASTPFITCRENVPRYLHGLLMKCTYLLITLFTLCDSAVPVAT